MRQKRNLTLSDSLSYKKKWKNDNTKNTKELRAAMLGAALGDSIAVPKKRAKTNEKNHSGAQKKKNKRKKEKHGKRGRSCKSSIYA